MKRIALAGLAGGIALFLWGAIAHMALDIGNIGMRIPPDAAQERILDTLAADLDETAVYMLPMLQKERWSDRDAQAAFAERQRTRPYAWIVFHPQRGAYADGMDASMLVQLLAVTAAALLAAWLVSLTALGFLGRLLLVTGLGFFAWLVAYVPLWNWYGFPPAYTMGAFVELVVGWALAGLAIAWLVRPRAA
jgi:Flp pilus assembly protein TadB